MRNYLEEATRIAGNERKLAKAIGMSQHAVWHARKRGSVSPTMAIKIEKFTKGAVTRRQLRPDLFA